VFLSCGVLAAQEAKPPAPAQPATEADLDALAEFLSGSFSSARQAAEDPAFRDVRLHAVRIWKDRGGPAERWLYVEQAMASALDKPYRQRVYKLERRASDGKLLSRVYTLPGDPLALAGEWKKDKPLAGLSPERLTEREGCAIVLARRADGAFEGGTEGKGCPSNINGAAYATSEVIVSAETLSSWDRGYDASGKQVWGAAKGPYLFRKDLPPKPEPPKAEKKPESKKPDEKKPEAKKPEEKKPEAPKKPDEKKPEEKPKK
jgi:hypothetical protein